MGCDSPAIDEIMVCLPSDLWPAITGLGCTAKGKKGVFKELGNSV